MENKKIGNPIENKQNKKSYRKPKTGNLIENQRKYKWKI